jgi:uncharacterized protein (DUF342 family)
MIDFAELRSRIQERLTVDREITSVETAGVSLDAAVLEAANMLGIPVRHIEYEVVEQGSAGFMGYGVKEWKIRAYISESKEDEDREEDEEDEAEIEVEEEVSEDGDVFVQLRAGDVFLKVIPPVGKGKHATEEMAKEALARRRIQTYNADLVKKIVREAEGVYARVAGFPYNLAADSFVRVDVTEDEMKAIITVTPPGHGGGDVPVENIMTLLRSNGVIYGIDNKSLEQFADRPAYGQQFVAAEGKKPINGMDAYMEYFFEVDPSKINFRENDKGDINFKELNMIQNVYAGQKLAKKVNSENGQHGRTVTGKLIPATDGKDMIPQVGKNAHLDKDNRTVIADVNGQVVLSAGKIGVEETYTVEGNVGIETGNIIFLGSVVVTGSVHEGYSVKATGNIEVMGLVDKAELDAEGEIIVRLGINGKQGISVRAGRSIVAKFIENANVKSGGVVIVSDGILNSTVAAQQRILVQGKRAAIIGGKYRAGEEIQSKNIGSASGNTETICEVGFDPEISEQIEELDRKTAALQEDFDDVQRNISTLETIKKQRKELPEEKAEYYEELIQSRKSIAAEMANIATERQEKEQYLARLSKNGRISASGKCYSGTTIFIKGFKEVVRSEFKCVTFSLDNGLIRVSKFEEQVDK